MDPKKHFNPRFPSNEDLRSRAKKRIPKFAFEYLDGGCNEEINLRKNTTDIQEVELLPHYLGKHRMPGLKTTLFGTTYDAPFGIAPVGLQGLIWPNAPEILAKAAVEQNIPFILSTVSTASIERIGTLTEGKAWFQLYHPAKDDLRDSLIQRAQDMELPVLVLLSDVPAFGYRPKDIKNGLALPPKMTLRNMLQILQKPTWALNTILQGQPNFETLRPYMPKKMNLSQLGTFMDNTFSGKLNEDKIAAIRDMWKGKLVLKGVTNGRDVETAIKLGLDGIIVSNHGGRQLDASESSIKSLSKIEAQFAHKITIMMDSGLRSGPDIARCLASGAEFTFLGRSFMYGVGALGSTGGHHTISMLKIQLQQVMEQLCCESTTKLKSFLSNRDDIF